jgi:hypothetical protein
MLTLDLGLTSRYFCFFLFSLSHCPDRVVADRHGILLLSVRLVGRAGTHIVNATTSIILIIDRLSPFPTQFFFPAM